MDGIPGHLLQYVQQHLLNIICLGIKGNIYKLYNKKNDDDLNVLNMMNLY